MFSPCTDGCVLLQSRVHFVVQEELRFSKQPTSNSKYFNFYKTLFNKYKIQTQAFIVTWYMSGYYNKFSSFSIQLFVLLESFSFGLIWFVSGTEGHSVQTYLKLIYPIFCGAGVGEKTLHLFIYQYLGRDQGTKARLLDGFNSQCHIWNLLGHEFSCLHLKGF